MDLTQLPPEIARRVLGWKSQYGDLIYVPYGGHVMDYGPVEAFVFRIITLEQYDRIKLSIEFDESRLIDQVAGEVLQECLLWPEGLDLDNLEQADFKRLYKKVSEKSPFNTLEAFDTFVTRARERYSDLKSLIVAFIGAGFPMMGLHNIERLNNKELGQYLIAAEHVLQRPFEVPGIKKKRKAPPPPSPDEVRAAKHLHAAQRREKALERAQERKRQKFEQLLQRREAELRGEEFEPQPIYTGNMAPPSDEVTTIPTPAATPPPDLGLPPGHVSVEELDRTNTGTVVRRFTDDEILDEQEPMMDADFKREKKQIETIWNNPEDVRHPDHDGPIRLGG